MPVNYCGVAKARRYARMISYEDLGFTSDDAYSDHVEERIEAASREIDRYCKRPDDFFNGGATLTEYHDGKPVESGYEAKRIFWLKQYPVITVTSVHVNKAGIGETDDWQEITKYRHSSSTGKVVMASAPASGHENVRFTYTAGYASVPADVGEVCASLVANELHMKAQHYSTQLVKWERPATFEFTAPEVFTKDMKRKLAPYVKRRI